MIKISSSNFSIWISFSARASCKFKIPVPATGVFASLPPTIFGAIKKYTLSTNFLATKLPLKVAPPSTKMLQIFCCPKISSNFLYLLYHFHLYPLQ